MSTSTVQESTGCTAADELRAGARAAASRLAGTVLIDGSLVTTASGATFDLHDPATRKLICAVADACSEDVDRAVASAARAQKSWAQLAARERGKLLIESGRRLAEHTDE